MTKKLDLENTRIYLNTQGDILCAFTHLGEEVYLSNDSDFGTYIKGKLVGITYVNVSDSTYTKYPFVGEVEGLERCGNYKYFILAKDVKFKEEEERKLRPFESISEFCDEVEIYVGDVITIKKNDEHEETCMFSGYRVSKDPKDIIIMFGSNSYTFEELKDNFKYYLDYDWHPFGIE